MGAWDEPSRRAPRQPSALPPCRRGTKPPRRAEQNQKEGNKLGVEGGEAIGEALKVNASLTSIGEGGLNLKGNYLGDEGWGAIVAGVCANKDGKIAAIDASSKGIGPAGAKLIGEALTTSVSASLTQVLACALMHTTPPPRPAGVATSMRH